MLAENIKKVFVFMCIGVYLIAATVTVQAEPIDTYRDMILKKTYTLKYKNITPETRKTNRNRVRMTKDKMDSRDMNELYGPIQGVIVHDGNNRYEETGHEGLAMCHLRRGDEMYSFSRTKMNNKTSYVGTVAGKPEQGAVAAVKYSSRDEVMYGMSFGDYQMTRFLNALLPKNVKPESESSYSRVASGTLPNGLSYVDYKADSKDNRSFEAIRYYFQGNQLVKIASGMYYVNENGELDGVRYIIKIDEFSPVADKSYLTLPQGLKDKTKRDKNGKISTEK